MNLSPYEYYRCVQIAEETKLFFTFGKLAITRAFMNDGRCLFAYFIPN